MIRKTAKEFDQELLDFLADDVKRAKKSLAAPEREKLDHYLEGFESLRDRRVKLATLDDSARVHIPSITDKFTSPVETHRLEAHFDLAAAALIAGLTNVVTFDADDLDGYYSGLGLGEKTLHGIGHLAAIAGFEMAFAAECVRDKTGRAAPGACSGGAFGKARRAAHLRHLLGVARGK